MMKRKVLFLFLIATCLLLTACSKTEEGGADPNSEEVVVEELSDKEAKKLAKEALKKQKEAAKAEEKKRKEAEKASKKNGTTVEEELASLSAVEEEKKASEEDTVIRIPKSKLSLIVQGFDGVYENTPITVYAWKDRKGDWQTSLNVDKKTKTLLAIDFDTSASSKVEPYLLDFEEEMDYLAVDLAQLKKYLKTYIRIISEG